MSQDDQDTTTMQEYFISGIVILFFGLLYWYLSNGFNFGAKDELQQSALTMAQVDSSSRLGSEDANKLNFQSSPKAVSTSSSSQEVAKPLEVAIEDKVAKPKDKLSKVADTPTPVAEVVEEVVAKPVEKAAALVKEEAPQETQAIASINEQLEQAIAEDPVQTPVQEEIAKEVVLNPAPVNEEQGELVYKLPDGTSVEISAKGFEEKFRKAIVDGKKNEPIIFDRIYFETGSKTPNSKSEEQIIATAAMLNTHPSINIMIRGHSDNQGSSKDNSLLSLIRSGSMKKALVNLGIDPNRIRIEGVGELEPVDSNKTKRGRRNNRRIDLIIKD